MPEKNSLFNRLMQKLEEQAEFPDKWIGLEGPWAREGAGYKTTIKNYEVSLCTSNFTIMEKRDGTFEYCGSFDEDIKRIQNLHSKVERKYKEWEFQKYKKEQKDGRNRLDDAFTNQ